MKDDVNGQTTIKVDFLNERGGADALTLLDLDSHGFGFKGEFRFANAESLLSLIRRTACGWTAVDLCRELDSDDCDAERLAVIGMLGMLQEAFLSAASDMAAARTAVAALRSTKNKSF